MEIIILIIILVIIFVLRNGRESFVNNTFSHLVDIIDLHPSEKPKSDMKSIHISPEVMPLEMPEEVSDHKYMGRLELNWYNSKKMNGYLYGKPLEDIHKLYSHVVFYVDENNKIIKSVILAPRRKISIGESFWVKDKNSSIGPYLLV